MKNPKRVNKRRTFSVREQLLGKLGPSGYGQLLQRIDAQVPAEKREAE